MKETKLVVSTDVAGLFATPKDWEFMWGFLKDEPKFAGFEMLCWGSPLFPWWPKRLLDQADKVGLIVAGIHGRVGKNRQRKHKLHHRAMIEILNETMVSTRYLLHSLAPRVSYILLHNTELRSPQVSNLVLQFAKNINCLQIENAYDGNDIEEIKNMGGFYSSKGINVGLTFDIYHYMHGLPHGLSLSDQWEKMLVCLDDLIDFSDQNQFKFELHVPVGEAMDDSVSDDVTKDQWKDLAKVIEGRIDLLTIESHPHHNDFLFPSKKSKERLLQRNIWNIERLKNYGVI